MVSLRFFIEIILPAAIGLGSTQPLTEMSIRNISCEIKAAGAYHLPIQIVWISGSLNFLVASGLVQGLLYILQLFLLTKIIIAELLSNSAL
jgi:hypothetical protein